MDHILIPISEHWSPADQKPVSLQGSSYRHFISEEAFKQRIEKNRSIVQRANTSPSKQEGNPAFLENKSLSVASGKEDRSRDSITEYLAWLNSTVRLMAGRQGAVFTRNAEHEALSRSSGQKAQYEDPSGLSAEVDETLMALLRNLPGLNMEIPDTDDASVFAILSNKATALERTVQGMMQPRSRPTISSVNALNKSTTLYATPSARPQVRSQTVQRRYQVASMVNKVFGESRYPSGCTPSVTLPVSIDGTSSPLELPSDLVAVASVSSASLVTAPAIFRGRSLSLLQQKFATEEAELDPEATGLPQLGVFGADPSVASTSAERLLANPHYDYRIMHGQALRTRAKRIYSTSVTSGLSSSLTWCSRHRVQECTVCKAPSSLSANAKANLQLLSSSRRESLASLIPEFLILSSTLFNDIAQDCIGSAPMSAAPSTSTLNNHTDDADSADEKRTFCASSAWYKLLAALSTQACLNGYLTQGWTGIEAVDVLLGVGCGGWDGRSWNRRRVVVSKSTPSESDSSESSDDEDEETNEEAVNDEMVQAAQMLFSVRSAAQAEFEREMRERKHEFLDVPESTTLAEHLFALSFKYSLSSFEALACQFFQSIDSMLGHPALVATYQGTSPASAPKQNSIANSQAMSAYMTRFFSDTRHSLVESLSETALSTAKRRSSLGEEAGSRPRTKPKP